MVYYGETNAFSDQTTPGSCYVKKERQLCPEIANLIMSSFTELVRRQLVKGRNLYN